MFRFAFFVVTCCVILMGMGVVPKPKTDDLPEFSMPEISMPEQPAIFAELGDLTADLPELGKRVEETIKRVIPRPTVKEPQVLEVTENVDVAVPQVATGPVAATDVVNFDLDKADLDVAARSKLNEFAAWLAANPAAEINIYGHTDLTGEEAYNKALGQNRADEVAYYLLSKGIQAERINVVMSYGETAPMVQTEDKSRENRRVKVETAYRS